jgi:hypothetical protein
MKYEHLEEAGMLTIKAYGFDFDVYALGLFHLHLQEIFDKVAAAYLTESFPFDRSRNSPCERRDKRRMLPECAPPVLRAEIRTINNGSLCEELAFAVPAVLADADVRAVLLGFASNVLFAIASSGASSLKQESTRQTKPPTRNPDVGDNVRAIALILAENQGGTITLTSKSPRGTESHVTIHVNANNGA